MALACSVATFTITLGVISSISGALSSVKLIWAIMHKNERAVIVYGALVLLAIVGSSEAYKMMMSVSMTGDYGIASFVSNKGEIEDVIVRDIGTESGRTTDVTTGLGYDAGDNPVRIDGAWTINDMKQALLGHPPRGLGSPDIHHGGQMPGASKHEVVPSEHRNNTALHPNKYNQGVTPEMRESDRQLHWWYRAREQGADELLPDWIYDD